MLSDEENLEIKPWSLEEAYLARQKPLVPPAKLGTPSWNYITDVDYGIRIDEFGDGRFQAARTGGYHSGIDFLVPEGSDVLAPCSGQARAGDSGSGYGIWVQLICPFYAERKLYYSSLLFAHLQRAELPINQQQGPRALANITQGVRIGKSGRSGNSSSPGVMPHIHFEAALHNTFEGAFTERHIKTPSAFPTTPVREIILELRENCLKKRVAAQHLLSVSSRIDPFLFLRCMATKKPMFKRMGQHVPGIRWSNIYGLSKLDEANW